MNEVNLAVFSELVSKKTGQEIVFAQIEKLGSGYHSDGFKLTAESGQAYFLKYVRSYDLGFEFPERQIMSLMVSNGMGRQAGADTKSVGVIISEDDGSIMLPDIKESTKIYQLQEFGGHGTSYSEFIQRNKYRQAVDDDDIKQLSAIADKLIKIHSVKHPSEDSAKLKAVYADGLRSILTNPELSLMVLSEFPSDYAILDLEGQKELIGLMYDNIKAHMNDQSRLRALHGDFWGANIFFKDDGEIFIIDFSRTPWGDPGFDVGWFISEFLWRYHATGNNYFKELIEAWLDIYSQKSGDQDIRKFIPLSVAWTGIVQIYPRWFPNIDLEIGRQYIGHIKKILKHKEFVWND